MNVGIVTTWFDRGAAFVSKQYADVISKEHDVYIFARGGEEYDKDSPYWKTYPVTWGKVIVKNTTQISWPQFKKWVNDNSLDVVIFNEQKDWEVIVDCRTLGVKTVAYIDFYQQLTVPFFSLYDALICNTERHFSVFKWHPSAYYIPWGTDVDVFKPKVNSLAQIYETPIFFHSAGVGGINFRKGTDILVRAFQQVSGEAKLVIHSQVPLSNYNELALLIEKDKRIEFFEGAVPPPGLFHLGNVYVYPSRLEGIGLTICEALAMGMPVITTNCAPMNEFVDHEKTGILVDVEKFISRDDGYYWPESVCNEDALANAMTYFVENPKKINELSRNARTVSETKFNWESNANGLLPILKDIVNSYGESRRIDTKIAEMALVYNFKRRETVWAIRKKVARKLKRILLGLQ